MITSIDTSTHLNYKDHMHKKSFLLFGILLIGFVSCVNPIVPETSPTYQQTQYQPTSSFVLPSYTENSPTPISESWVLTGDEALSIGDYSLAQTEFKEAIGSSTDVYIIQAAIWGLGRTHLQAGNYGAALNSFNELIVVFPNSPHRAHAHFMRGEIMMYLQRYAEAIEAYTAYLSLSPDVIDNYVFEQRADAYIALKKYDDAVIDYVRAFSSPHIGADSELLIKLARAYESLEDTESAFEIYTSLFNYTTDSHLKAQMDLFRGRLYLNLAQFDQAYSYFLHSVENYPYEYESYSALVALVDAGVYVSDYQRGLVDYYAGQYGLAIDAFNRYADNFPKNDGSVYYYRALALRDSGFYPEALEAFSFFINNYSSNNYWSLAWEEKADIQWYFLGDYDAAVETMSEYSRRTSDIPSIPEILLNTGRIFERSGDLEGAVSTWELIADQYPGSELVPKSLFLAGIVNYRMGKYDNAKIDFQRSYLFASTDEDQIKAVYWTAKTQKLLGDDAGAQSSYLQAASIDQSNFYSLRAQDALFNRMLFEAESSLSFEINSVAEREIAESWMRVTFNLPPEIDLTSLGSLMEDNRFVRGNEFYALDMIDEAKIEFEDIRQGISESAVDCYRFGNYLLDMGFYRSAIFSLRQVLTLAGMDNQAKTLSAPRYFNFIRYGDYYRDLIIPRAISSGFDPVFIFSVVRQESLYDRYAGSGKGALGLMQITPATAQLIVDGLGWPPEYSTTDLFRPKINITLGISHLSDLKTSFSNELFTTLAAYNAGRNAALIWRELSGPDPDLFLEVIRYPETYNYIKGIYEIFYLYQFFYSQKL